LGLGLGLGLGLALTLNLTLILPRTLTLACGSVMVSKSCTERRRFSLASLMRAHST